MIKSCVCLDIFLVCLYLFIYSAIKVKTGVRFVFLFHLSIHLSQCPILADFTGYWDAESRTWDCSKLCSVLFVVVLLVLVVLWASLLHHTEIPLYLQRVAWKKRKSFSQLIYFTLSVYTKYKAGSWNLKWVFHRTAVTHMRDLRLPQRCK